MALNTFGWTPSEVTTDSAGNVISGVTLTVFTDVTKATQVTTLYGKDGVTALPSGVVVSDNKGRFGFKASDAYSMLYVYDGSTADPWPIAAHEALDAGMASHAQAVADAQAAADSAAASAALVNAPADTAIKTAISNPATQSGAYLGGTFAKSAAIQTTAANTARLLSKLTRGVEDASLLIVGDSTGNETVEWVYLTAQTLASRFPAYTVIYHLWDATGGAAYDTGAAGAATTLQTGTGSRTLHIWNFSVSGQATWYGLGSRFQAGIVTPNPDLIIVSHGHNEGSTAAATTDRMWRGQYLGFTETVTAALPDAGVVMVLQNPQPANTDQQLRARVYESLASGKGYGIIDVLGAFLATGNAASYVKADGVHPTTINDAPAPNGSQLWADTVAAALVYDRGQPLRTQSASTLTSGSEQLLPNGSFAAFGSAVPDGWTVTGAATSKDTRAGYYESVNGYGVRVQATGAAQSKLEYLIAPYAHLKGKWVTLAVRLRIDSTVASQTAGRIAISDGVNSTTSQGMGSARDGLHWRVLTHFIAANATYLRITVYGDSAANASADVTVDRVDFVRGTFPRLGASGAVGPAGPTGPSSPTQVDHLSTYGTNPVVTGLSNAAVALSTANQGIFMPVKPHRSVSLAVLAWLSRSASGNYDIGIYDDAGNRLWSKGSAAWPTGNTLQADAVAPAVALTVGTRYWVAFSADNTTGTFQGATAANAGLMALMDGSTSARLVSNMFPLPATVALGAIASAKLPAVVLREA